MIIGLENPAIGVTKYQSECEHKVRMRTLIFLSYTFRDPLFQNNSLGHIFDFENLRIQKKILSFHHEFTAPYSKLYQI